MDRDTPDVAIGGVDRDPAAPADFIRAIVADDLKAGRNEGRVSTRFPPEPNGYLHIGHAKSICLNFGIAAEFSGMCNLRFDDTNPTKEDVEYVQSIEADIRWLGFKWEGDPKYASDYFETLYEYAVHLIRHGDAYVDSQSADEIRQRRGTLTEPGSASPFRDRSVEENLDLFARMRAGEFEDGAHVLRARIDMASPNINMRDPGAVPHPARAPLPHGRRLVHLPDVRLRASPLGCDRTDYALSLHTRVRGPSAALRLAHRSLAGSGPPRQIEFARLNLTYTVTSKRKLLELVQQGHVNGWDDPRMPTIVAMRRRGYTPEAIRNFCERIGVAKRENVVDVALLEHAVREDLNRTAPRVMGVLNPLRVVIENYPEGQSEMFDIINNPEDPAAGTRQRAIFPRTVHRARRFPRRSARRSSSGLRPAAKCGCAVHTSSPARA